MPVLSAPRVAAVRRTVARGLGASRQVSDDLAAFAATVLTDAPLTFSVKPSAGHAVATIRRTPSVSMAHPLEVVDVIDAHDPFEPADRFARIEGLTPDAVRAVDGMHPTFVREFRQLAGPCSTPLAETAWGLWRDALLQQQGVARAEHRAKTAMTPKHPDVPVVARVWLSRYLLRAAAVHASRRARDVS